MNEKTLADFQKQWEVLVDKAFKNFSSLTNDERIWFTIQSLIQDVDNGGLISHYYNSGADWNKETIEDLKLLGFEDIADYLIQINNLFPNGQPQLDMLERNDTIDSWPDDGKVDNFIEYLDDKFSQREEYLEAKLVEHILAKVIIKNK